MMIKKERNENKKDGTRSKFLEEKISRVRELSERLVLSCLLNERASLPREEEEEEEEKGGGVESGVSITKENRKLAAEFVFNEILKTIYHGPVTDDFDDSNKQTQQEKNKKKSLMTSTKLVTTMTSTEGVKRECFEILERLSNQCMFAERFELTLLLKALERTYLKKKNLKRYSAHETGGDDYEFWARIVLFLLRLSSNPTKSEYAGLPQSWVFENDDDDDNNDNKRREEKGESTIEKNESNDNKMFIMNEDDDDDSLSEWSDDTEDEEERRKEKRGGTRRNEETLNEAKDDEPVLLMSTKSKEEEQREEDIISLISSSEDSLYDDDDERDLDKSILFDDYEEEENEKDPGFSWRSLPGGTADDVSNFDVRSNLNGGGDTIIKNNLFPAPKEKVNEQNNRRRISRASSAIVLNAQKMLQKLNNSNNNNDDDSSFSSFLSIRGSLNNRGKNKISGESAVVTAALNATCFGNNYASSSLFDLKTMEISHVSKNGLDNVLKTSKQIIEAFEDVNRIKDRLKNLSTLFVAESKESPTVQAFVNALVTLQTEIRHSFDNLIEATRRASVSPNEFSAPTLLRLSIENRKLSRKSSCLHRMAEICSPGQSNSVGKFAHPATAASTILSNLYNLMNEYASLSSSNDEFSIVFRCFLSSSTSYFNALDIWVNFGILTSPELFIFENTMKSKWRDGWYMRESKDVPIFLKSVADDVLNAGIFREFSRMKKPPSDGEEDDIRERSTKKLTFVSKMIAELKALLLLNNKNKKETEEKNAAGSEKADYDEKKSILDSKIVFDELKPAFDFEDALSLDLKRVVSLTRTATTSRKKNETTTTAKQTTPFSFSESFDFVKWVREYFENKTSSALDVPIHTLVSKSILDQIRVAAMCASDEALEKLKSAHRLKQELLKLRALFLGSCGEVFLDFSNFIFEEIDLTMSRRRKENNNNTSSDNQFIRFDTAKLTEVLRDAIFEYTNETTFGNRKEFSDKRNEVRVQVFYTHPTKAAVRENVEFEGCEELQALTDLNIVYQKYKANSVTANLICDAVSLSKYNEVFKYLLQLRYVQHALDRGVVSQWTSERRRKTKKLTFSALEIELKHFVTTLRSFVITKILSTEWKILLKSIDETAQSVDDVKSAHDVYLENISRVALASADATWSLLSTHIKSILSVASEFGKLQRELNTMSDDDDDDVQSKRRELAVKRMEKKFTDSRVKVMQILQHRTGGEDEDIETLYEQLNFNNYY